MKFKLEPQISRPKRRSAVEQTSDLLKAYLEHWPDSSSTITATGEDSATDFRAETLMAGFILPERRSA